MAKVRCRTAGCYWTGNRKTDAPVGTVLEKPCPNGHEVVAGGPPPTAVDTTPTGIEIAFWDETNVETGQPQQRHYKVDGKRLPSVTTILGVLNKPALLDWAARFAREGLDWRDVRDEAGDRGHNTHELALDVVLGKRRSLSSLPAEHRAYGQAAMSWVLDRQPEVIEAERMIASVEHGYSGRTDLLALIGGHRVLADYKTVSRWHFNGDEKLPPYPENALQLDLYANAAAECGYEAPDLGLVVRLGPDGEYHESFFELDYERGLRIVGAYTARAEAAAALAKGVTFDAEAVAA